MDGLGGTGLTRFENGEMEDGKRSHGRRCSVVMDSWVSIRMHGYQNVHGNCRRFGGRECSGFKIRQVECVRIHDDPLAGRDEPTMNQRG